MSRMAKLNRSALLVVLTLGLALPVWSQQAGRRQPAGDDLERQTPRAKARAVVKIERPEGVCYWAVTDSDDLVRLPVSEAGFSAVLLSARLEEEAGVQLSVAGEARPLETTVLGRFSLPPASGEVEKGQLSSSDEVRLGAGRVWRIRLISPAQYSKGIDGCCTCNEYKLTCCPSLGHCLGCGLCGDCCNE